MMRRGLLPGVPGGGEIPGSAADIAEGGEQSGLEVPAAEVAVDSERRHGTTWLP
jgi:hypothetical protein